MISPNDLKSLYCVCRQAERTVDVVLWCDWAELTSFYGHSHRHAHLQNAIRMLSTCEELGEQDYKDLRTRYQAHGTGSWQRLKSLLSRNKGLSAEEQAFIRYVLCRFVKMLDHQARPTDDELIRTRLDCCLCEQILIGKGLEKKWLQRATAVEHLNASEYLDTYSIEELLADT